MNGAIAVCLVLGGVACGSATSAAGRDPMKCERDPSCARARGSYSDCTRQCVDDIECIKRCEQVQKQNDSLGH